MRGIVASLFAVVIMLAFVSCRSSGVKSSLAEPTKEQAKAVAMERPRADASDIIAKAAAQKPAEESGNWQDLFDGKSLTGWCVTDFAGAGEVEVQSGLLVLGMGSPFTGVSWTNEFPKMNYAITLEAMRVDGSDFFCGLTFPVGDSFCSLICGGWGGALVGLSSIDGMDASENDTTTFKNFERGRWYRIRLRVTEPRIEAWIDDKKLIDIETADRKISVRPGDIEQSIPMGIASWQTTAALRGIKIRRVESSEPGR